MFRFIKSIVLSLTILYGLIQADAPAWAVNESDYSGSASLTSIILLNEAELGPNNIVGAFFDDVCRGVSSSQSYEGTELYYITVFGNSNSENINFKVWVADSDTILPIFETIQYEYNATFGSPDEPLSLNSYVNFDFSPQLLGIPNQVIEIGTEFSQITLSDYLSLNDDDVLSFSISEIGSNLNANIENGIVSITSIDPNWIGSDSIVFTVTEETENNYSDSDTVNFEILALDNAPILSGIPDQTIGTYGNFLNIDLPDYLNEIDGDSLSWSYDFNSPLVLDETPSWNVNNASFTLSMSATIRVKSNGKDSEGNSSTLAAFSTNGTLCGIASATEYSNNWLYFITIYSNSTDETISFRFYDNNISQNFPVLETIQFYDGEAIGQPDSPIVLNSGRIFLELNSIGNVSFEIIDELWTGTETLDFTVQDLETLNNYTSSDQVSFTVLTDFSPILSQIPDQSITIGESFNSIDLEPYTQVFDDDEIIYDVETSQFFALDINGSVVSVEPLSNEWIGSELIIFKASDNTENNFADTDTVLFEVQSVDHEPILANIPDQTVGLYGSFIDLALYNHLTEVDGDTLAWDYAIEIPLDSDEYPDWDVNPSNFELSMSATIIVKSNGINADGPNSLLGAFSSDDILCGHSSATQYLDDWIYFITIYSNSIGDTITFKFYDESRSKIYPVLENTTFSSNEVLGGPDAPLIFQAGHFIININSSGIVSTDIVDESWMGSENITFTVTDISTDNNYQDSDDVLFSILTDSSPLISGIPDQSIQLGSNFTLFDLADYVEVFDDDDISYSASESNHFEVTIDGSNVTLLPLDEDWIGSELIEFTVTDISDNSFSDSDTANFEVRSLDTAPTVSEIEDQTITVGESFELINLDSYLTELDGDSISWEYEFLPQSIPTPQPDWDLNPSDYEYSMNLTALIISQGNTASGANHSLAAVNNEGDILGVCTATEYSDNWIYFLTIYSNIESISFDLLFYDSESERILPTSESLTFISNTQLGTPDNPSLIYAGQIIVNLDSLNNFSFQTTEVIWQYPEMIRFTAVDETPDQLSSSTDVMIMIDNDYPVLNIDNISIDEGESFNPIPLIEIISDNSSLFDSLIISITGQNIFDLTIASDTLFIERLGDENWFGQDSLNFQITDNHPYNPLTVMSQIMCTVNPVNDPPILDDILNTELDEDMAIEIELLGSDIDSDSLRYSASLMSGELDYEITNNILLITPLLNWNGSAAIHVFLDDYDGGADTTQLSLTINAVNDAPVSSSDTLDLNEDSQLTFNLMGEDVENDILEYQIISEPDSGIFTIDSASISYIPNQNWFGQTVLKYLVHDGFLSSDTGYITLKVLPVNDIPLAVLPDDLIAIQGQTLIIDGSNSYDEEGSVLTYLWDLPDNFSGPPLDSNVSSLILNVPEIDNQSTFSAYLRVNDGEIISNPDTLLIEVLNLNVNDILPDLSGQIIEPSSPINIIVEIPNHFESDSISLNYTNAVSDFTSIQMIPTSNRSKSYSANIDSNMVGIEGIAYFVYTEDNLGNTIKTDTIDIQISFESDMIVSSMDYSPFINGLSNNQWRIISLPGDLDNKSVSDIFSTPFNNEPDPESWMILDWADDNWTIPQNSELGKGYWIKQLEHDNIHFSAGSGKSINLTGFNIMVKSGWNLISSPYIFPVNIRDNDTFSECFYYDGVGWADTTINTLVPWSGYAIFNYSDTTERLDLRPLDKIDRSLSKKTMINGWKSNIYVNGEKLSDNKNSVGSNPMAKSNFDNTDCPEPPVMEDYVSFYSFNKFSQTHKKLTKDFRQLGDSLQIWNLNLESNQIASNIDLRISTDGNLGSSELWFLDLQNYQAEKLSLEMDYISTVKILNPNQTNHYKLFFGKADDVHEAIQLILDQIPKDFRLQNSFPNPFNSTISIPFDIPIASDIRINIFDLRGRLIRQITNDFWPVGIHKLTWNGLSERGHPMSSGIYFIRMESQSGYQNHKIILLK